MGWSVGCNQPAERSVPIPVESECQPAVARPPGDVVRRAPYPASSWGSSTGRLAYSPLSPAIVVLPDSDDRELHRRSSLDCMASRRRCVRTYSLAPLRRLIRIQREGFVRGLSRPGWQRLARPTRTRRRRKYRGPRAMTPRFEPGGVHHGETRDARSCAARVPSPHAGRHRLSRASHDATGSRMNGPRGRP